MSKGGRGAAANVLMLKKAEDRRQESALKEAFKVSRPTVKVGQLKLLRGTVHFKILKLLYIQRHQKLLQ